MRAIILGLAVSLCAGFIAHAPLMAQPANYSGRWRVDLLTDVGNCPKSGSAEIVIKGENIDSINISGVEPWGYINEDGEFVGHFNSGSKVLRANGKMKARTASGPWSSQTEFCGGRWTARKID